MAGRSSLARVLSSTAVNSVVGALGLLVPAATVLSKQESLRNAFAVVCAVLVVGIVFRDQWLKSRQLVVARGDPALMADEQFFRTIERDVVQRAVGEIEDLADGYLRVFAAEVPYISTMLFKTLLSQESVGKTVHATDLTRDPKVLMTRREYLAVNRQLVRSGGSIQRVFICRGVDMAERQFADDLLKLVDQHRAIGVTCGLAVRERLRPTEAVDFVIFGGAAVLVEDEQGGVAYAEGRSTVHFRRLEAWRDRFTTIWESNETPAATEQLARFERVVRSMTGTGQWRPDLVQEALDAG